LNITSGEISGTPTAISTNTTYTITARNTGGTNTTTITIVVNDEAPDISYNPDWFVLTNNTAMSPTATPTNSGGAIPSGIIAEPSQVGSQYSEGRYNSIAVDSNGAALRNQCQRFLGYDCAQESEWYDQRSINCH
jgi:hypothetical protein